MATGLGQYNDYFNSLGTFYGSMGNSAAASTGSNSSGLGFGGTGGWAGGLGSILGGVSSLASGWAGLQNVGLAKQQLAQSKKQFAFEKGLANRNLANQAKIINNTYGNAAQVAGGMAGGSYGLVDPSIVQSYADKAKEQYVSGEAIG